MGDLKSVEESFKRLKDKNKRLSVTISEKQKVVDKQKTQIQQKQEKIYLINQKVSKRFKPNSSSSKV